MNKTRRRLVVAIYLGLLAGVVALWAAGSWELLLSGSEGMLIALARLAALTGSVAILAQFVLISRSPWLEPAFGFDRLTRIHRTNGVIAFVLISLHIPLVIGGYSLANNLSGPEQMTMFLEDYRYVLLALIAYVVLVLTIIFSIIVTARRLGYEVWHLIHLFNYTVLFLAIWHQVTHGHTLVSYDWFRYGWYGLHLAVLGNLLLYRFFRPVWQARRHRFRVERVVREADGVVSIYVSGRNLDKFRYRAGQFAKWRFLAPGIWGEEHPFTISVEPNGRYLRLTPKAIGGYTAKIQDLPASTRAVVSGPLGEFTLDRADSRRLLFIAGGIGITPIRAMCAVLPDSFEAVLLYVLKSPEEAVFKQELEEVARSKNLRIHYIYTREAGSGPNHGHLDRQSLRELVPDITEREVFICGPTAMMDAATDDLIGLGVDSSAIHSERFTLQ